MAQHWYLVIAKPNMDVRVARDLGEQGYEALAPKAYSRARINGRMGVRADMLLSPYVFVAINDELRTNSGERQNMRDIRETLGVSDVVALTTDLEGRKSPSEVPQFVIRTLRYFENADFEAADRRVRRKESRFQKGDAIVVVAEGVTNGLEGVVGETRHGLVRMDVGPQEIPWWLPEDHFALVQPFQSRRQVCATA